MVLITELLINYQQNPIGVKEIEQIGWKIISDQRNVRQKKYELQISEDKKFKKIIYDSGVVEKEESAHVELPEDFAYLRSLTRYYIRVRVETNVGISAWKLGEFVTALIYPEIWQSEFITIETDKDADKSEGSYLRKEFTINSLQKLETAYICATALGLYQLYLNGKRVGKDEFTPGWTSYNKNLLYQTYDVKDMLLEGKNVLAVHLGAGWYKGDMGFARYRNHYGKRTAFSGFLRLQSEDGIEKDINTDTTWIGRKSPILFSEFYDGEVYDSRLETLGWNERECKIEDWQKVCSIEFDKKVLHAQSGCTVRKKEEFPVQKVIITPKGETVLDFGQEVTGWLEFPVSGKCGEDIQIKFFEVLDKDGNVYCENLRSAKQTITYICNGMEAGYFHPHFSFQGFRYAYLKKFHGIIEKNDFVVHAIYSDMRPVGRFDCSSPEINQLHKNILWGMKDNFLDIPTDCPQRDERLGWTGDAQIFSRTATYLMDTYTFYSKWLQDLAKDQLPEGGIPHVIPDIVRDKSSDDPLMKDGDHSASAWADAAVIIPWVLYTMYGDKNIIEKQYESMKAWIDFMHRHSKGNIWNYKLQMGDWLALDAEEGSYFGATPNDLTCTAFYAHSTELFARMSKVINKEEAACYEKLAEDIKATYFERFFDSQGHLKVQTQTAQILTLKFGLVPEEYRENVKKDLLKLLEKEKGHLVTGFVGTPYFCYVLSENDCIKEAYELLFKDDFPSWLYQIKMGATTIWEHWDGIKPDGNMWSAEMNSFNHYAYGAVGEWLYRRIGGIDYEENSPGFKQFRIVPCIDKKLQYAEVEYESLYGTIATRWEYVQGIVHLSITVPVNTTASIELRQAKQILENGSINFQTVNGCITGNVGSGKYEITFKI